MMDEIFNINKSLLNPKFEGYKLHLIPQEEAVLQIPLANQPTQAAASGKTPLAFQEVQSRITHNHLTVCNQSGRAAYVDADYKVVLIDLNQDKAEPSIHVVYELPKPIQSDAVFTGVHREYPSAAFANPALLLVSDGQCIMYALRLGDLVQTKEAVLVGKFVLPPEGEGAVDSPFRIHHVYEPSPSSLIATLSSRYYTPRSQEKAQREHNSVEFDVRGVAINIDDTNDHCSTMQVLWHRRGEGVPLYATYDQLRRTYLLVGGSEYHEIDQSPRIQPSEPGADEIMPIPGTGEYPSASNDAPPKPPPYSWTQTSDSVTIAIPLPFDTPKDKIKVLFSSTTLTVHVDLNNAPQGVTAPRYSAKKLWDEISTTSSFWTFDREAESTFGVLSLHLEKRHEGTRWSHVFADAGTDSKADDDVDVPETLDPSELWSIREALEKYTTTLQREDTGGLDLGRGVPSLAENEIDEEVDPFVGQTAYITWVPDPSIPIEPELSLHKQYATPFQLLSTPLPGIDGVSLIVKNNIDGAVFTLDDVPLGSLESQKWKHTATYPALAFVLASKRDTRFTYHIPNKAVFAFEGGSSNRGGNVYLYYPTAPKSTTAKQSILKINNGSGGALMGVGLFTNGSGKTIIACLTEGELTLIKDI